MTVPWSTFEVCKGIVTMIFSCVHIMKFVVGYVHTWFHQGGGVGGLAYCIIVGPEHIIGMGTYVKVPSMDASGRY
jgi:hypothetical protein